MCVFVMRSTWFQIYFNFIFNKRELSVNRKDCLNLSGYKPGEPILELDPLAVQHLDN